jgi:tetratricopeptide (TPR) repeat protein
MNISRVPLVVALAMWFVAAASLEGSSKIDEARELQRQGKLAAAHDLLSAASSEYRASGDRANLARAAGIAADISISLGRYEDAVHEAAEVLKLHMDSGDQARIGDDYNTLGLAHQYQGNYSAALDDYRKALAADRAHGDAEGEITRLNNIGNVFYFQGRYSDALASYDEAMRKLPANAGEPWMDARRELTIANLAALFQRLGQEQRALEYYQQLAGAKHSMPGGERAQLLLNEGALYRRLGDPVKALELYRSAQGLFATDRHRDGEIGVLRNIGIALAMDMNDLPQAIAVFTRALQLARKSSNTRAVVQASLYRGELRRRLNQTDDAEKDLQSALRDSQSLGLVEESWKALYALGRIEDHAGRTLAAAEDYRRAISIIESVRSSIRLTSLRSEFLADKREVYDSLIDLRLRDSTAPPAEIFNWMERSRARTLSDRLRTRVAMSEPEIGAVQARLAPGTVLVEFWMGFDRAAAIWITNSRAGLVRYDNAADFRTDAAAPGDRIFRNISLADHLIIVPDGTLSAIPFETLGVPGSSELLVEKCDLSYLPSARLLAPPARRRWLAPWATEIVMFADPPVVSNRLGENWQPLPASAEEARAIGRLLPGRSRIHLGEDAQKRYLHGPAMRDIPLLHFGTHAMIDEEIPERSRILLANDYLFQEEVYDLDLTGVDLVTLSACDTARGKVVRGESTQALNQAFLAAGASATVTTLWSVSDQPAAEFMKQFYYELSRGESKSSALRLAKLRFLRSHTKFSNPRYWAAFVLTGDGTNPIPLAIPWRACLAALAALIAAVTLAIMGVQKSRRTA